MKPIDGKLRITARGAAQTKTRFCGVLLFLCCMVLFAGCSAKPDEETLRLYMRAKESYAGGNFAETVALLEGLKKFPPALILKAKAEYFSDDFEKAEVSFKKALKLRPAAFEPRYYLARMLYESGKRDEAVQAAEELLADNNQDIRALRLVSAIFAEAGRDEEAAAFLDRAVDLSAESALVLLDRGRLRWIAGRGPEALEDLGRASAMLPWDTPLLRSIKNLETRIKETLQ